MIVVYTTSQGGLSRTQNRDIIIQLKTHNGTGVQTYSTPHLVVRGPPRERKIQGLNPACAGIFSGSSHTSDSKIGTPVATLPGAWCYRVSAGTGRPGVSILWLGEVESWICNFYLSVAARKIVWADPWDTLACCWDVKQPTNKQTNSTPIFSYPTLISGAEGVRRRKGGKSGYLLRMTYSLGTYQLETVDGTDLFWLCKCPVCLDIR